MLSIENVGYKIDKIIDGLGPILNVRDLEMFLLQGMNETKALASCFSFSEVENISIDAVCYLFPPSVVNKDGAEIAQTNKKTDSMSELKEWRIANNSDAVSDMSFSLIDLDASGNSLLCNGDMESSFIFGQRAFHELLFLIFYYKFNSKYFNSILVMPDWRSLLLNSFATLGIDVDRTYRLSNLVARHYRDDLNVCI